MKVGLALGGGGARGFTHIGILRVLHREKIPIDLLSGTSMGAVVGSVYARTKDPDEVYKAIKKIVTHKSVIELEEQFYKVENGVNNVYKPLQKTIMMIRDLYLWNLRVLKRSFVDSVPFEKMFHEMHGDRHFSDCLIPFQAVATDLIKGDVEYIDKGLIYKAILASIALPGIFSPLKYDSKFLVDGGIVEPVPIDALEGKANFIFAISLEPKTKIFRLNSSLDVMVSADEMRHTKIVKDALQKADFVFEPEIGDCSWAQFSRFEELVRRGEDEANQILPDLKKAIKRKKYFPFLGQAYKQKHASSRTVHIINEIEKNNIEEN